MDSGERIAVAHTILDRNLAWIAAAEGKAGFAVAIDTAMLAGLATAYADAEGVGCLATILVVLTAVSIVASVICAGLVVRPRTDGPERSLFFFGRIAEMTRQDYSASLASVTDGELLNDLADQIHRNAEIASEKHSWSRRSINAAFIAGMLWIASIAFLVGG